MCLSSLGSASVCVCVCSFFFHAVCAFIVSFIYFKLLWHAWTSKVSARKEWERYALCIVADDYIYFFSCINSLEQRKIGRLPCASISVCCCAFWYTFSKFLNKLAIVQTYKHSLDFERAFVQSTFIKIWDEKRREKRVRAYTRKQKKNCT